MSALDILDRKNADTMKREEMMTRCWRVHVAHKWQNDKMERPISNLRAPPINFEMIGRDEIPSAQKRAVEQKGVEGEDFPMKRRKEERQSLAVPIVCCV